MVASRHLYVTVTAVNSFNSRLQELWLKDEFVFGRSSNKLRRLIRDLIQSDFAQASSGGTSGEKI